MLKNPKLTYTILHPHGGRTKHYSEVSGYVHGRADLIPKLIHPYADDAKVEDLKQVEGTRRNNKPVDPQPSELAE